MKIDFSKQLVNLNGEPLKEDASNKPVTLGYVIVNALLADNPREPLDGTEKLERYELAKAIYKGERNDLSAEEVVLIKQLVGKLLSTLVVGQIFEMLDSA